MRIAVIADVHSNYPALEATLDDIAHFGVDEIIVAGDSVNGGPFPAEVIDRLEAERYPVLLGNHEQYVLDFNQPTKSDFYTRLRWGSVHWTASQLHAQHLDLIKTWPHATERRGVLMVHGSPDDLRGGVSPKTTDSQIEERFGNVQHRWVVTAHTHQPFVRQWRHLTLINPGSVGMPLDGNPMAAYAVLTFTDEGLMVQHRRVAYDVQVIETATRERGLLEMGGSIAYLMMRESMLGRHFLSPYLRQVQAAIDSGLSEDEAFVQVPLPI